MHQATTDKELTQHWLSDPSHKLKLSFGEARSFLSFIKNTDLYAKQFKKPVLIVQGLNDHLVSPNAVAKLFKDMASSNKTLLIDGKGEHLIIEEGRFCPALLAKLIAWIKSDDTVESTRNIVEIVDDEGLSAKENHHLSILSRTATQMP
jgi:alpha-beta hydrolase superfamily lysophospholipase